jgi:hypothetical protein
MGDDPGLWWDPQPTAIRTDRFAEMAESVAFTLERLASTYRLMAGQTSSNDKTARLLGHVARLENLIEHERAEAARLRQLLEP